MTIPVELLGLSDIKIIEINLRNNRELVISAESTKEETICRNCGKGCKPNGSDRPMELRHLPILGYKTFIQLTPKRGICHECEDKPISTTQTLSWYDRNARQTKPYEQHLLFELINSTVSDVSRKEEVDYNTIQRVINKHIETEVDFSLIFALGVLGIDEISLRKGRKRYVTVITYKYKGELKILKVIEGRTRDDVEKFFSSIPKLLQSTVSAVCSDLYEGYINAAKAVFGKKVITADRFHVAKLYRKQLITVRKSELKRLRSILSDTEYKKLHPAVAILRKGKDYFNDEESEILKPLFTHSPKLQLAYIYSHRLTTTFNSKITKLEATAAFKKWIDDVTESELNCFKTFVGTLGDFMNEITNYFVDRNTSAFVEGFNNRLKVMTRRCYGLKKVSRFFQRIKLDTEGLELFRFQGGQVMV
jgi:transposase